MKEKIASGWDWLRQHLQEDEIFHETGVQANKLGAMVLFNSGLILALIYVLTCIGIFPLSAESIFKPAIEGIVEIVIVMFICRKVNDDAWWLRFLLIAAMLALYGRLDSILTHKAGLVMVIPVIFSARYFSKTLTLVTAAASAFVFACSAYVGATRGFIDLNIVSMPAGVEIITTGGFLGEAVTNAGVTAEMLRRNVLLYNYIPKLLVFIIPALISVNIARRGHDMVITQHEEDMKSARIESELDLARRIQSSMMPGIFPPYPEKKEFDIYASMNPAKEVGGDFYDFYLIDEDHLVMVMADVSGKGIPAALFMMIAKVMIQNAAARCKSPAEILKEVNDQISQSSHEEMFVTVWLGILELSTGLLTASSAGHEYPIIADGGSRFEIYKDKHGLVVGAMEGVPYTNYEIQLRPGSRIFLYTDGVPEAKNKANEQFGMDRLVDALNSSAETSPWNVLATVHDAVNAFTGEEAQFDDLTMMCLIYNGLNGNKTEEQA